MFEKLSQLQRKKVTLQTYGADHIAFRNTNPSPKEVRSKDIRIIVAEDKWQNIRHYLVGTWNETPIENVKILEEYLGDGADPIRVRQLLNYVTGSGFRIGIISHSEISVFRDKVRKIWKEMLNEP